ncbi:MAG: DUF4197 domain-containing protein [Nitrospiraceae bacterium]|nr:DUF4197 domain-containing protein [Nitrospiraceae bacterium]
MKAFLVTVLMLCSVISVQAAGLEDMLRSFGSTPKGSQSSSEEGTTAAGLKEALAVGTENAVKSLSKPDGYFGNELVKILMPEKLRTVADVMKRVGYQQQVDEFVLSMNRAAEKAAPEAASIFGDAIREMTFDDARKILAGGDTSATDFFKEKTHDRLYAKFKPIISSSMDKVGMTRSYKEMMGKYESLPFMSSQSFDLDHYVTNKALDGLFLVVGQEEKNIRTNPAARTTDLLKSVFGGK